MRSLMWINAIVGLLLIGLSAASYRYAERSFLVEDPPTLSQKITEIQDVEHLRKLALLLVRGNNQLMRTINETFSQGIKTFATLSLCFAVVSIMNWLSILKHARAASGKPLRWLRWL
jgi:hypothetical protein